MFKKILVRKLLLLVVLAFVLSGAVFLVLQKLSSRAIEEKYRDSAFVAVQMQKEVDALQSYIRENDIAIENFYKITQWVDRDKVTSISLYYEDRLIYDSDISYRAGTLSSGIKRKPLPWKTLYPIQFKDAEALMSLTVYLKHHDYDKALLGNLIIFFLVFMFIVLLFVQRKTKSILELEHQVQLMQGGKLDLKIYAEGNDEISSLAESLEEMRQVFVKQIEEEKERNLSSKEFASTMAHDIRTPLSALIGYLDILIYNRSNNESKRQQYLVKSAEKADQLRSLTDHLFDHFLASKLQGPLKQYAFVDHKTIETLLIDCVFLLESEGYRITNNIGEYKEYRVHMSRESLQRVIDNLISNILKYADKKIPLTINLIIEGSFLTISFTNAIKAEEVNATSTGLGLKVCRELIEKEGGKFEAKDSGRFYQVEIKIPLA